MSAELKKRHWDSMNMQIKRKGAILLLDKVLRLKSQKQD